MNRHELQHAVGVIKIAAILVVVGTFAAAINLPYVGTPLVSGTLVALGVVLVLYLWVTTNA
ncbi:hypothetical protein JCM17823_25600 [Halorubrum gandharaense]